MNIILALFVTIDATKMHSAVKNIRYLLQHLKMGLFQNFRLVDISSFFYAFSLDWSTVDIFVNNFQCNQTKSFFVLSSLAFDVL